MNNLSKKTQGIIYVGLCIVLWSLIPVFAKYGQSNLNHHQYLFYSSIMSFLSLFVISLYNRSFKEIFSYSAKTFLALLVLGFFDFFYYLLLYFGYKEANGLEVLVMQYTWPIFIVILSIFALGERLNTNKILSLIFGFIGVCVVVTKGDLSKVDFTNLKVISIVLIGAFSFAMFSVFSKKIKVNLTNAVMIYFFTAIIYSFVSMNTFSTFVVPQANEWVPILVNGIFLNGISYLFWIKALQNSDASFIAPFIFIIPILSAFFLISIFDEPFLWVYLVGLVFIILSGLSNSIKLKR